MIRSILGLALIGLFVIVGVNLVLSPNDLKDCGKTPGNDSACLVADAVVAISGGDTNARVDKAIDLYKNGWAKVLIFAGAAEDKTGPSNAEAMKERAIAAGVSETVIVIETESANTKENAQNLKSVFTNLNLKRVILVTSAYHQKRAYLEFNKISSGAKIVNSPVETDNDWSSWWWTTIRGWTLAVSEIVKIAMFYIESIWS